MTAYTLKLKLRDQKADRLMLDLKAIGNLVKEDTEESRKNLFDTFKKLSARPQVHDKRWLEMIVNFTPRDGAPLTELAKWLGLAKRVADLDDTREGTFTLSQWHVDLIWSRLSSDKFVLVNGLDPLLAEFLLEFMQVTGKNFPDGEPKGTENES